MEQKRFDIGVTGGDNEKDRAVFCAELISQKNALVKFELEHLVFQKQFYPHTFHDIAGIGGLNFKNSSHNFNEREKNNQLANKIQSRVDYLPVTGEFLPLNGLKNKPVNRLESTRNVDAKPDYI
jgi:hypothetical protein